MTSLEALAALRRKRDAIRRRQDELDDALAVAIRSANAAGESWVAISDAAGLGATGQAAQMWLSRYEKRGEGSAPAPRDGTLSRKDAAAAFGVTEATFAKRLSDPTSEVSRRTTVIPPGESGRKVPRYRVAAAE